MNNSVSYINDSWSELNQLLEENQYSQLFVLVDSNTHEHCLPLIQAEIKQAFEIIEIEPGEASKDLMICQHIWHDLTAKEADRNTLLINLGGGVVTDLGGYIAANYKRGIDFVNIPTSLLAMVDASSGGKCGINFLGFKNQLGAFKNPKACYIHTEFLKTLAPQEVKSGFAEMLKHGLISDANHWKALLDPSGLNSENIKASITIKQEIVKNDPFESGERKKLNFGHTIGHAIESYLNGKELPISHGFAISAGMLAESYISHKLAYLSLEDLNEIQSEIIKRYPFAEINIDDFNKIMTLINQDKKNEQGANRFTLLSGIGKSLINIEVSKDLILESLQFYLQAYEA